MEEVKALASSMRAADFRIRASLVDTVRACVSLT